MARKRPTSYVPLSVHYADDSAIMDAGEDAELMFLRMLAYAGRTPNTEGFITRRVCLTRLGIDERPEVGPESAPEKRLERLQEVGLVTAHDDGFQIVSWLRWNRSLEEMGQERAQDRARKQRVTRESPEPAPETDPESGQVSGARSRGQIQKKIQKKITTAPAEPDRDFIHFWTAYPKKVDKGHAIKAFKAALKKTDAETIISAAESFAEKNRSTDRQFIANPATWLNGERWADEESDPEQEPTPAYYTPPTPPDDMPTGGFRTWNLACHQAHRAGEPIPTCWADVQVTA